MVYIEFFTVVVLILINALLAMAELAIVSSRRARLQGMVDRDVVGSRRALALARDPGKFLSTVQIGITLVGVISGAFSGATIGLARSMVDHARRSDQRGELVGALSLATGNSGGVPPTLADALAHAARGRALACSGGLWRRGLSSEFAKLIGCVGAHRRRAHITRRREGGRELHHRLAVGHFNG